MHKHEPLVKIRISLLIFVKLRETVALGKWSNECSNTSRFT